MSSSRTILLALLCCLAIAALSPCVSATEFSDVPSYHWAWTFIQAVSNAGIATGYSDGTYKPDLVVTRDQMAVYVARALAGGDANVPTGPAIATFSDVPVGHWAYQYVEYCADPAQGVVQGYSDQTYKPELPVNRDAMAVYIARAVAGGDSAVPSGPATATFTDVDTNQWAFRHIEYCAAPAQGIVNGYSDGTYRPGDPVTRAQMAVYVCRAFSLATPSQTYNVTDFFPVSSGRIWVYQSQRGDNVVSVGSGKDIGGQTFTQLVRNPGGHADYWQVASDGLRLGGSYNGGQSTDVTFQTAFTIPNGLHEGDTATQTGSVSVNGTPSGQASFTYMLVGTETIIVPLGTFQNCLKLELDVTTPVGGLHEYLWLAAGVGIVKLDATQFGGSDWADLEAYVVPSTDAPAPPYNVTDYFPVRQGDTWTYIASWGQVTNSVAGTTTLLGQSYGNFTETDSSYVDYWRSGSDGIYIGGFTDDTGGVVFNPAPRIPNGMSPGQTGVATFSVIASGGPGGAASATVQFVEADDVYTPAGEFPACMKWDIHFVFPAGSVDDRNYNWFARNVGKVLWDSTAFGGTDVNVLLSASVGGVNYP